MPQKNRHPLTFKVRQPGEKRQMDFLSPSTLVFHPLFLLAYTQINLMVSTLRTLYTAVYSFLERKLIDRVAV